MTNQRMTKKERGLVKGALRRAFSRSDLRQQVLNTASIEHIDASRPRVKKWSTCNVCKQPKPRYLMVVDHIDPLVPVNMALEDMSWDIIVDRLWCEKENLQVICPECHNEKSKRERVERKIHRKGSIHVKYKAFKRTSSTNRKRNTSRSTESRAVHRTKKACRFKDSRS